MCAVPGFLRSWIAVSQPSSRGIMMSSVMTSGAIAVTLSRQSWPSIAVATSNPRGSDSRRKLPDHLVVVDYEHPPQTLRHLREGTRSGGILPKCTCP